MTVSQPSPMDATRDKCPGRESVVSGAPRRSLDATAIQATPPRQLNHTDAATRQHIRAAGPRRLMTDSALRPAKSNSLAHNSGPQQPNSDAVGQNISNSFDINMIRLLSQALSTATYRKVRCCYQPHDARMAPTAMPLSIVSDHRASGTCAPGGLHRQTPVATLLVSSVDQHFAHRNLRH